jgi:putative nucleotidyltransferase with HDIG domain
MITRDDVEALFAAQLDKIDDGDLRKKVVDCWVTACKRGGWESIDELTEMPFTLLTDTHGVNFIEHTIAVTEGALALGDTQMEACAELPYPIDFDRLVAGGLLHDVGKLVEIIKDGEGGHRKSRAGMCARHPISGAILAAELGLPDEIINTIACHAKEGDGRPQCVETVLIHQADFATFNPLVMLASGKLIV